MRADHGQFVGARQRVRIAPHQLALVIDQRLHVIDRRRVARDPHRHLDARQLEIGQLPDVEIEKRDLQAVGLVVIALVRRRLLDHQGGARAGMLVQQAEQQLAVGQPFEFAVGRQDGAAHLVFV